MKKSKLWQILVPAYKNDGQEIEIEHHKKWDVFVQKLTNGLTIQKTSRGIWLNQNEIKYEEKMIPVKISCSKAQIKKISNFTAKHYEQEAVMFYLVSKEVHIVNYNNNFKRIKKKAI
ncbi:MAG TPA: hypothetical protein VIK86_02765 [Candidatus Paceibacterota bacterium]